MEGSEERGNQIGEMKIFFLLRMGMIWSFFLLLATMIGTVFPHLRVGQLYFFLLLCVILEEKVVGDLLVRYREEKTQRWREAGILMVLAFLGFSLLRGGTFQERFIPDIFLIYRVVLLFLVWLVSTQFREGTGSLSLLLRALGDRRGEELTQYLREESFFIREVREDLTVLRGRASLFLLGLGLFLFLFYLFGYELGGIYLLIVLILIVQVLLFRARINHLYEELRLFGEGLRTPQEEGKKMLVYLLVVLPVILFLLHLLTLNLGVVPPEIIESFFRWLSSLFKDTGSNFTLPESWERSRGTPLPRVEELLREFDVTPAPFWTHFWKILEWTALIGGGMAILVLLFGPLFSRRFRAFLAGIDVSGFFMRLRIIWEKLAGAGVRFLGNLRDGAGTIARMVLKVLRSGMTQAGATPEKSPFWENEGGEESSRLQREKEEERELLRRKRGETRRMVREIKRIFRWAKGKGLVRRTGETLEEFFSRLSAQVERNDEFVLLREIFQESRFSKYPVEPGRKERFFRTVRDLLRR